VTLVRVEEANRPFALGVETKAVVMVPTTGPESVPAAATMTATGPESVPAAATVTATGPESVPAQVAGAAVLSDHRRKEPCRPVYRASRRPRHS
jgi:hypothetical protein